MDIEKTIRDYLAGVFHMSLATCVGDKPWVVEVHFAYDEDLNLYFRSKMSRRHSEEIAKNPNVAGSISEDHKIGQKTRAVYFEGTAEALKNVDSNHPAFKAIDDRFSLGDKILEEPSKDDGHDFYKITVSDFYLTDSRESNPSQKYHLPWRAAGDA